MLYRERGVVRIELFSLLHPRKSFLRSVGARKESTVDRKNGRVVRRDRKAAQQVAFNRNADPRGLELLSRRASRTKEARARGWFGT